MAGNMLSLTSENFEQQVVKSAQPVLVDFWAEWCGPCKSIAPILDTLAKQYEGKMSFGKVNVDDAPQLASDYNISSIPTLLIFKNGQIVEQVVGLRSERDLKAKLDAALA